ncbi:hypothetical protein CLV75_0933 [Ruegeria conchae]|uniref:Uncharacterized protein n=1 Tax=Ruegeria conchae TaxID=981384 RepID=A0A497ZZB0_9RHOB|nr:hypothetical protein CLV75_0933 [Ruegeria conchae]
MPGFIITPGDIFCHITDGPKIWLRVPLSDLPTAEPLNPTLICIKYLLSGYPTSKVTATRREETTQVDSPFLKAKRAGRPRLRC